MQVHPSEHRHVTAPLSSGIEIGADVDDRNYHQQSVDSVFSNVTRVRCGPVLRKVGRDPSRPIGFPNTTHGGTHHVSKLT